MRMGESSVVHHGKIGSLMSEMSPVLMRTRPSHMLLAYLFQNPDPNCHSNTNSN
jgi:hypothetical protein